MLDIAVSYNKFKFLGNEFLTWLWYIIENDRKKLVDSENNRISLVIGNRIIIENKLNDDSSEVISIKGDDADLKEVPVIFITGHGDIENHWLAVRLERPLLAGQCHARGGARRAR